MAPQEWRPSYDPDAADRATTRLVAQLALAAAGFQYMLTTVVSATLLVVAVLVPVVVPGVRRAVPTTRIWFALLVVAFVSGWVLRADVPGRAGAGPSDLAWGQACVLLTGGAVFLLVLWARSVLPLWRIGVSYGIGLFAAGATTSAAFGPTGYKFFFAVPIAIITLSLADRWGSKAGTAAAAIALGLAGILDNARSYLGFCVLTAVLLTWLAMRGSRRSRMNRWAPALLIVTAAGGVYWLATFALTKGLLGADLQTLSTTQVDESGSLIVGGRPEWAGTLQLMRVHPWGYGPDVLPSWTEVVEAKQGLASVGLNVVHNGYVDNYMFGDALRLHSVVADLWAEFGLAGLVLGLLSFGLVGANLSRRLADRSIGGLAVFVSLNALWVLAFGPIYTNWRDVCLALGLLVPLGMTTAGAEADPGPAGSAAEVPREVRPPAP